MSLLCCRDSSVGSGFYSDFANSLGALQIWPEHRYYGPVPYLPDDNIYAHLNIEQALVDQIELVLDVQRTHDLSQSPVVAIGSSYSKDHTHMLVWQLVHAPVLCLYCFPHCHVAAELLHISIDSSAVCFAKTFLTHSHALVLVQQVGNWRHGCVCDTQMSSPAPYHHLRHCWAHQDLDWSVTATCTVCIFAIVSLKSLPCTHHVAAFSVMLSTISCRTQNSSPGHWQVQTCLK